MPKEFKFVTETKIPTWGPMIIVAKRNASELGYYKDDHFKYFCPKTTQDPFVSFYMYMRIVGVRKRVERFFDMFKGQKVQFVNLGCGTDTMCYWVLQHYPNAVCYDLDLEFEVKVKVNDLLNSPEMLKMFPNYKTTDLSFHSDNYHLYVLDLSYTKNLDTLKDYGFSDEAPTVYLNEFFMIFINDVAYDNNIKYCSTLSKGPSMFVTVEYTKPNTTFGKWYNGIYEHTIKIPSLYKYPSLEDQVKRFVLLLSKTLRYKDLGWDEAYFFDFNHTFTHLTDRKERDRLRSLENYQDWHVLGVFTSHSCIGVALKNVPDTSEFVKVFENEPAGPDEPVPVSYSVEDLENVDVEPAVECVNTMFRVAFDHSAKDCREYYDKYK